MLSNASRTGKFPLVLARGRLVEKGSRCSSSAPGLRGCARLPPTGPASHRRPGCPVWAEARWDANPWSGSRALRNGAARESARVSSFAFRRHSAYYLLAEWTVDPGEDECELNREKKKKSSVKKKTIPKTFHGKPSTTSSEDFQYTVFLSFFSVPVKL